MNERAISVVGGRLCAPTKNVTVDNITELVDRNTFERANLESTGNRNANGFFVADDVAAPSLSAAVERVLGKNVVDVVAGGGGGGVEDAAGETSVLDLGHFVVEAMLDLEQARRVFDRADDVLVGVAGHSDKPGELEAVALALIGADGVENVGAN